MAHRDEGPLTPDEEVTYLRHYFFDDLKAPGVVAVVGSEFRHIPDGRRRALLSPNGKAYSTNYTVIAVVIDPQGTIRRIFTEQWRPWFENRIAELIQKNP